MQDQLVVYSDYGHLAPLDVANWHLAVAFNAEQYDQLVNQVRLQPRVRGLDLAWVRS